MNRKEYRVVYPFNKIETVIVVKKLKEKKQKEKGEEEGTKPKTQILRLNIKHMTVKQLASISYEML